MYTINLIKGEDIVSIFCVTHRSSLLETNRKINSQTLVRLKSYENFELGTKDRERNVMTLKKTVSLD